MTEVRRFSNAKTGTTGTIERLQNGALIVNPHVLSRVQKNLSEGRYDKDRSALITEVQRDPALYLRTAKELSRLNNAGAEVRGKGVLPERDLLHVNSEELQQVFHPLLPNEKPARKMTPAQALRIQHSVIASRASEELASRAKLNCDVAFSGAMFRQLGMNMMAWNFPAEYARALNNQKQHNADVSKELEQILGISPEELSQRLAEAWGIDSEVRETLTRREPYSAPVSSAPQLGLHEICDLAELFAKANDPEHYSQAPQAWALEEKQNESLCGGISSSIQKEVQASLGALRETHAVRLRPSLFDLGDVIDALPEEGAQLFANNRYIRGCQPAIQELVQTIYAHINGEPHAGVIALKQLVDSVIPAIGFQRGCLYLLDDADKTLRPALRMGDVPKEGYQEFKLHRNNIITASLDATIPIMQRGVCVDNTQGLRICGGIEARRRSGVLYIEIMEHFFDGSSHDPLVHFRVIRQALIDCLNLKSNIN